MSQNLASLRRAALLREMGLGPLWRRRTAVPSSSAVDEARIGAAMHGLDEAAVPTVPALMPGSVSVVPPAVRPVVAARAPDGDARRRTIAGLDWAGLASAVAECRSCRLCERRKQAVLGVGDRQADWLFVGEAPGAEEDERGEPFVGQAGKLLDAMLAAIDLQRGKGVYIANTVKCRPPGNRTPEAEEMASCFPFLERQIQLIQPRLIVALGRPAAQALLESEVKINAARGRRFEYRGVPVIVTYHPAYLLRNLPDKAKAWEDLCFAQEILTAAPQGAKD